MCGYREERDSVKNMEAGGEITGSGTRAAE